MTNLIKYLVILFLTLGIVFLFPKIQLAQQQLDDTKQPIKLKLEVVKSNLCKNESLEVKAKVTNTSKDIVAFYPKGLWGRLTFLAESDIKNGIGRAGVLTTTGHSFNHKKDVIDYTTLKPNETVEYSRNLSLNNKFFETTQGYLLQIRYFNINEQNDDTNQIVFLKEITSNKVKFEVSDCANKVKQR